MLGFAGMLVLALFLPLQGAGKKTTSIPKIPTKIYLNSGHSFQGQIVSEDETTLKLSVSYGQVILRKDEIKSIVRGDGIRVVDEAPLPGTENVEREKQKTPVGFQLPPSLTEEEKAANAAQPAPVASVAPKPVATRMVQGFLGHFLWFLPDGDEGKFLCGAIFFLGFLFLFFLASKMAGIEDLSLGKALGFCAVFFIALAMQVHFDAHSLGEVVLYGVINVALWFGLVRYVLREPVFRGAGMLALFVFAGLLGVLASQLGFVILHQNLTT